MFMQTNRVEGSSFIKPSLLTKPLKKREIQKLSDSWGRNFRWEVTAGAFWIGCQRTDFSLYCSWTVYEQLLSGCKSSTISPGRINLFRFMINQPEDKWNHSTFLFAKYYFTSPGVTEAFFSKKRTSLSITKEKQLIKDRTVRPSGSSRLLIRMSLERKDMRDKRRNVYSVF